MDERSSEENFELMISDGFKSEIDKFLDNKTSLTEFLTFVKRMARGKLTDEKEDKRAAELIVLASIDEGIMTLSDFINGRIEGYDIEFGE